MYSTYASYKAKKQASGTFKRAYARKQAASASILGQSCLAVMHCASPPKSGLSIKYRRSTTNFKMKHPPDLPTKRSRAKLSQSLSHHPRDVSNIRPILFKLSGPRGFSFTCGPFQIRSEGRHGVIAG